MNMMEVESDGGACPGPGAPVAARVGALTGRQREVACLLVEGLTYAQIAARLSLSEHTVHEHLRQIYARLGCRRGQLIALLVRAEACDPPQK